MHSKTKKSIEVREYFYGLEELIDKYKNYIIEGLNDKIKKLENNQKPKINPSKGIIYIIQTADDKSLYKIGKTKINFDNNNKFYCDFLKSLLVSKIILYTFDLKK